MPFNSICADIQWLLAICELQEVPSVSEGGGVSRPDYIVRGMGPFPVDMLRYDSLEPFNHTDTIAIQRSHESGNEDRIFIVRLKINAKRAKEYKQFAEHPFTERRWKSFGWNRIYEERERL